MPGAKLTRRETHKGAAEVAPRKSARTEGQHVEYNEAKLAVIECATLITSDALI
jgi:hypothetical protein